MCGKLRLAAGGSKHLPTCIHAPVSVLRLYVLSDAALLLLQAAAVSKMALQISPFWELCAAVIFTLVSEYPLLQSMWMWCMCKCSLELKMVWYRAQGYCLWYIYICENKT